MDERLRKRTNFTERFRTNYFAVLFSLRVILLSDFAVVAQSYEVEADNEYVIRGNSAVMKCEVPSFVSDFVFVEMWEDSLGNTFMPGVGEGKQDDVEVVLENPVCHS